MTAWAVTVWRDGTPVTDAVPVSDWLAGEVGAGLVASMFGGPVSLARGVVEQRVVEAKAAEDPTVCGWPKPDHPRPPGASL